MFQRLSAALALLSVSVVCGSAQTTPYEQLTCS